MAGDALVFIPGIKGTKLVETNKPDWDTIWSGAQSNFESIEHLELARGTGGRYVDRRLRSIIRPGEIEALAYEEFVHDLETDRPVYVFSYDWRRSAVHNGERLREFLAELVEKSKVAAGPTFKTFDFVTHSLGSHVLRAYLARDGFAKVEKIVFTAPPFLGSIDIAAAGILGEGWFKHVKSKLRQILRSMPGALELLPTYAEASAFKTAPIAHSFLKYLDWQSNVRKKDGENGLPMKKALADARGTVKAGGALLDLAAMTPAQKKKVLVIARHGYETYQSVRVDHVGPKPKEVENLVDFGAALRTEDGDGRVPHISSCAYAAADVKTLMLDDALWYREYEHGLLMKDERVQELVNRFLFRGGRFTHRITGDSIKRVTGLQRQVDGSGLPHWTATLKI